jgi:hypothetical protein
MVRFGTRESDFIHFDISRKDLELTSFHLKADSLFEPQTPSIRRG